MGLGFAPGRPGHGDRGPARHGGIVRVKKGLYVFGLDYRRGAWSREVLANLIYGPSYVSLDYALDAINRRHPEAGRYSAAYLARLRSTR